MKIIKIAFISIIVLVIVLTVAAIIFIKTFDVNRFKPQIISQVNKMLNRQLDFEKAKLAVSLRQGVSFKINNLNIADDPEFGKDNFLSIQEASLGVDLLKWLFQKKINISNIIIESPRIIIIRKKDGSINAQSIAQKGQVEKKEGISVNTSAPLAIPALLVSSLQVNNGKVIYIDNSFEPSLQLEVSDLSVAITKFSLSEKFPFLIEAAILSSQTNIKISGKAQIDLKMNEVTISELKAATDLSRLLIEKIPAAFPMLKGVILPVSLKGIFGIGVQKITAGLKGLSAFTADASLTNGEMQLKKLAVPVKDIDMTVKITNKNITIETISASIGQGTIKAQGLIGDYLAKQSYSMDGFVDNLNLLEVISQDNMPVKTEGIVATKIKINGEGFSPEAVKVNLSGAIDLFVEKAKLKDINVLRTVLDKISVIPGLSGRVAEKLPDKFKDRLDQKDTSLADLKLPVSIENGRFLINDAALGADEFMFNGNGYAGFDGMYSLEGSFLIPAELSSAMVNSVEQLQYLLNSDKQIYIPLKISGRAMTLKFTVNGEYIAKKMLIEQGTQQLFKVIDKALGSKEEPQQGITQQPVKEQPTEPGGTPQQQGSEETKQTTEGKIRDILQGIFK
jgi:hypothetical protein